MKNYHTHLALAQQPIYIQVNVNPRYWEDTCVNGQEDFRGTLIPFRKGEQWCPIIRLADGQVMNWPQGITAFVHYKVCDEGEYFLLDTELRKIFKYRDYYVPDHFLCHGLDSDGEPQRGYGDYIILSIDETGLVQGYKLPLFYEEDWETCNP